MASCEYLIIAKALTKTGVGAIRDIFADARRAMDDLSATTVADPDPSLPRDGIKPGQWAGAPHDAMPPNCPVHVIGRDGEGIIWCRNACGDLRGIDPRAWTMATISDLFSPFINYAFWAWPAIKMEKKMDKATMEVIEVPVVKRVERDKLFTCLGNEASKRPLFDPTKQHRGRGGWSTSEGQFIWHSGKHLWSVANSKLQRAEPQELDGFLYTRQPFTIEPWAGFVECAESPANRILQDLRSWEWERPYLDPLLVIGWLATAFMGGAAKVRPIIFTVGGHGVGKSTMHELLKNVLEGVGLFFANTTAAGIYQKLKHDVVPVMVDELENQPGRSQHQSIIDIARIAYTGGDMARGGADHEGVSFSLRSSFYFAAINPPPMTAADRSRMAMLNLSRLEAGTGRKILVKNETDGRMILRQIMDGWKDYNENLLQKWWDHLAAEGMDSRGIDTYGTLLAAAELVLGEQAMDECGLPVFEPDKLRAIIAEATAPDKAERLDNWHKCLNLLFSSSIDAWRDGQKPTVGSALADLAGEPGDLKMDLDQAKKKLDLVNLTCLPRGALGQPGEGPYLCVPTSGPQLSKLFQGSDWEGGGWNIALKQGIKSKCVIAHRAKGNQRINGVPQRCLLVDWSAFINYAEQQG